jgi:putative two-component system response regulator
MNQESNAGIIVVDDQPANLKLMEDMLIQQGYRVRSFPRGRLALTAAAQQLPDLILLDINMPEMDGFEVCRRLKTDEKLASVPVIFLSALNETESKLAAFRAGGVDYITKPFQFEEVHARVDVQLQLQLARRAERQLLEKTLSGAVRTLADLIHLTEPAIAARSQAIRGIAIHLATAMGLEDLWQYDLAATLCLMGCVALPPQVFDRVYGREAQPREEEMFQTHPESGARLLANIPRLENVAEIIRRQHAACGASCPANVVDRGACILRIAVELDRRMFRGLSFEAALRQLKSKTSDFPLEMLQLLDDHSPPLPSYQLRRLMVHELRVQMIAEDDVVTKDGSCVILRKGTVLIPALIERIRNFEGTRGIDQPVLVRVPQGANPVPSGVLPAADSAGGANGAQWI